MKEVIITCLASKHVICDNNNITQKTEGKILFYTWIIMTLTPKNKEDCTEYAHNTLLDFH